MIIVIMMILVTVSILGAAIIYLLYTILAGDLLSRKIEIIKKRKGIK